MALAPVKPLPTAEELAFVRAYQSGDNKAGEALLKQYDALIAKYARRYSGHGVDTEDIIQDGRIAFLGAVNSFDPSKGNLIGHAIQRVWSSAQRAVNESGSVRVAGWAKTNLRSARLHGHETPESMVEAGFFRNAQTACNAIAGTRCASLDAPIGDQDGATWQDITPDGRPLVDDDLSAANASDARRVALATAIEQSGLSDRDQEMFRRRHLRDDAETMDTLGTAYGLTKQRVCQIEARAIVKVKAALARLGIKSVAAAEEGLPKPVADSQQTAAPAPHMQRVNQAHAAPTLAPVLSAQEVDEEEAPVTVRDPIPWGSTQKPPRANRPPRNTTSKKRHAEKEKARNARLRPAKAKARSEVLASHPKCAECSGDLCLPKTGRLPKFCSRKCRAAAWFQRRSADRATAEQCIDCGALRWDGHIRCKEHHKANLNSASDSKARARDRASTMRPRVHDDVVAILAGRPVRPVIDLDAYRGRIVQRATA